MAENRLVIDKAWRDCIDKLFTSTDIISNQVNAWRNEEKRDHVDLKIILSEISNIRFELIDFESVVKRLIELGNRKN